MLKQKQKKQIKERKNKMKEYVVVANDEPSIDSVHDELTSPKGSTTIPDRVQNLMFAAFLCLCSQT